MTNDAVIHGEVVQLSETEVENAAKFHKSRIPFIWIDGNLYVNRDPEDDRDHQHWVLEDFGISVDAWENLNRGYMLPNRIQLFKGSDFRKVHLAKIPVSDICMLLDTYDQIYSKQIDSVWPVSIFNGVHVGAVGEVWLPIDRVFDVTR